MAAKKGRAKTTAKAAKPTKRAKKSNARPAAIKVARRVKAAATKVPGPQVGMTGNGITITPFLWFDNTVEEAVRFYTGIFPTSKVHAVSSFSAQFSLQGQEFHALNGGPLYKFTPAVSFFVSCDTQTEVDYFWNALLKGGREDRCGWLTDRFGLSWQIIPRTLIRYLGHKDPATAQKAMQAMLKMAKIDIAALERAVKA